MKPLSERDENSLLHVPLIQLLGYVGMKPLSERDENSSVIVPKSTAISSRNEATL